MINLKRNKSQKSWKPNIKTYIIQASCVVLMQDASFICEAKSGQELLCGYELRVVPRGGQNASGGHSGLEGDLGFGLSAAAARKRAALC